MNRNGTTALKFITVALEDSIEPRPNSRGRYEKMRIVQNVMRLILDGLCRYLNDMFQVSTSCDLS